MNQKTVSVFSEALPIPHFPRPPWGSISSTQKKLVNTKSNQSRTNVAFWGAFYRGIFLLAETSPFLFSIHLLFFLLRFRFLPSLKFHLEFTSHHSAWQFNSVPSHCITHLNYRGHLQLCLDSRTPAQMGQHFNAKQVQCHCISHYKQSPAALSFPAFIDFPHVLFVISDLNKHWAT